MCYSDFKQALENIFTYALFYFILSNTELHKDRNPNTPLWWSDRFLTLTFAVENGSTTNREIDFKYTGDNYLLKNVS